MEEEDASTQFNLAIARLVAVADAHGLRAVCQPQLDDLLVLFRRQRTLLDRSTAELQRLRAEPAPKRRLPSGHRPRKRALLSSEGEQFRAGIVDHVPPTGLVLAQLSCNTFPTEILRDGDHLQEVVARDGPVRRLRLGLFRDGVAIAAKEVAPEGLHVKVELRHEGRVVEPQWWLHAVGPDNPTGKTVFAEGFMRPEECDIVLPIAVKALSSDRTIFPACARSADKQARLKLAVVVDAARHGGSDLGVGEATTRSFVCKAKADASRAKLPGSVAASRRAGAHRNFSATASVDALGAGGGRQLDPAGSVPVFGLNFLMQASFVAGSPRAGPVEEAD